MGDETSNTMNLDLNLGPGPDPDSGSVLGLGEPLNLENWIEAEPVHRIRDGTRPRTRHRWRWRPLDSLETENIALELIQLRANSANGNRIQTGEGSGVPFEERIDELTKMCENKILDLEDEVLGKKGDEEKGNGDTSSFFDCNICLDLSKDPVVTCCGHLFCWSCLYRWLHVHSEAKECPVCKGQVTIKNVTPIYGRGNNNLQDPESNANLKIPLRPQAQRVESLRQSLHRNAFTFPMEGMIRRLGHRFDLIRDVSTTPEPDTGSISPERNNSFLNRIMTSRGMRSEQNGPLATDDVVDLTRSTATSPEPVENHPLPSLMPRRHQLNRAGTLSSFSSALSSAGGLVDAYIRSHSSMRRNLEQAPHVDDRDSYSSIAAVINSESQTADNAVEIDSIVSFSTSTSRRRNEASRVSDVDSGDSRAPRRRRLS